MDKEFKKEWIIKIINKIEDKEYLDEITIKLLEIQNKLK